LVTRETGRESDEKATPSEIEEDELCELKLVDGTVYRTETSQWNKSLHASQIKKLDTGMRLEAAYYFVARYDVGNYLVGYSAGASQLNMNVDEFTSSQQKEFDEHLIFHLLLPKDVNNIGVCRSKRTTTLRLHLNGKKFLGHRKVGGEWHVMKNSKEHNFYLELQGKDVENVDRIYCDLKTGYRRKHVSHWRKTFPRVLEEDRTSLDIPAGDSDESSEAEKPSDMSVTNSVSTRRKKQPRS